MNNGIYETVRLSKATVKTRSHTVTYTTVTIVTYYLYHTVTDYETANGSETN